MNKMYKSKNRLIEINNIIDYDFTNEIKCDIKTIVILLDKYSFIKNNKKYHLNEILNKIIKHISSKNNLSQKIKKICLEIENDIINNKITETILTLEINCGNTRSMYKFIFMNVKNILLDILNENANVNKSSIELLNKTLLQHIDDYLVYCRKIGSIIYKSMKTNNVYQCNIINCCSRDIYKYLNKNKLFKKNDHLNPFYFEYIELLLFEGFCLSKYKHTKFNKSFLDTKNLSRVINNSIKYGGNLKKKNTVKTNLIKITLKNKQKKQESKTRKIINKSNYYLNMVNLDYHSKNKNLELLNKLDNILMKVKSISRSKK
jgi:hypothetical protein